MANSGLYSVRSVSAFASVPCKNTWCPSMTSRISCADKSNEVISASVYAVLGRDSIMKAPSPTRRIDKIMPGVFSRTTRVMAHRTITAGAILSAANNVLGESSGGSSGCVGGRSTMATASPSATGAPARTAAVPASGRGDDGAAESKRARDDRSWRGEFGHI